MAALAGGALLVFGHAAAELGDVQGTGYFHDFRRMPLVYSAGDIFPGTSLEEAFGQTYGEAAACGLPWSLPRGRPGIARQDVNALAGKCRRRGCNRCELRTLIADSAARAEMGRAGRKLVEDEFTLRRQGERWTEFLQGMPS